MGKSVLREQIELKWLNDPVLAFYKVVDFSLEAAELHSKVVSFLNNHFQRESSTGKPEPLASAAFDTLPHSLLLWFLDSA